MKTRFFFIISSFNILSLNAQWFPFAAPSSTTQSNPGINSIFCDQLNDIYAGGVYPNNTVKWNGNKWVVLDPYPLSVGDQHLCGDMNGNIFTNANIFANSQISSYVTKFDGVSWNKLGNDFIGGGIYTLFVDATGKLYAAGNITNTVGNSYVAQWDGNSWSELGGFNSLKANAFISSICGDKQGNIYVGGAFTNTNGSKYVAKWDGNSWVELGGANSLKANNIINAIASDNKGNIYVGGAFTNINGNIFLAKYNGQIWNETALLGSPSATLSLNTISCDKNGNTYISTSNTYRQGVFNVFKLIDNSLIEMFGNNPCQWSFSPGSSMSGYRNVSSISLDTAGNIYAVGGIGNANCNPVVMKYSAPWLVGIDKQNKDDLKFSVYPNPINNKINFNISNPTKQKFNLCISDAFGQVLIEKENAELTEALDVSNLRQGIYFIQIQNKAFKQSFKVVKE